MEYYIDGEKVAFTTASVFFERYKEEKGYYDEFFRMLERTEEGRDIIGEITEYRLEIVTE